MTYTWWYHPVVISHRVTRDERKASSHGRGHAERFADYGALDCVSRCYHTLLDIDGEEGDIPSKASWLAPW